MKDKVFTTYDQQIQLLKKRGVCFDGLHAEETARKVLLDEGYYNLINGYSKLFLENGKYLKGTTINEIHALYVFDRELRRIFFQHILNVEVKIKSLISYEFSKKYGHSNYLIYGNFDTKTRSSMDKITKLLAEIQRQIASKSGDPSIAHYLNEYGYVPLWVLNNILTFGTISKFYSLMKQPERQSISKHYGISDKDMESVLHCISSVRNYCAHGNRIYCYRSRKPVMNTIYHKELHIKRNNQNEYLYGKRDLFSCVLMLKIVLSYEEFSEFVGELTSSILKLSENLKTIKINEVLEKMGFCSNWNELKLYGTYLEL